MKYCLDCKKIKSQKGNYCKKCGYKHRIRPKGLKYKIIVKNKGWIKKGEIRHPFKKNHIPWNKNTIGVMKSNKTSFTRENKLGIKNNNWKGNNVGYHSLHLYLNRKYGKPYICEFCNSTNNVQWASKNYKYTRNKEDWLNLCFKCHRKYDSKNGWGIATKKFNL